MSEKQMPKGEEEIMFRSSLESKAEIRYRKIEQLNNAGTGKVYKVEELVASSLRAGESSSGEKICVLKVCASEKSEARELFRKNMELGYSQPLEHFVNVLDWGEVDGKPAYTMNYEGSDLKKIRQDVFPSIEPTVAQAVKYKTLLTVATALEKAHNLKQENKPHPRCHNDLGPGNITTGFDYQQYSGEKQEQVQELKQKLIHCEIKLCDPINDRQLGTSHSATGSDVLARLLSSGLPLGKDRDVETFLGLYLLLQEGEDTPMSPSDQAGAWGLPPKIEKKGILSIKTYEPMVKFKERIVQEIEATGYFLCDELNNSEGKKYPVVFRPIDKFSLICKQKMGDKLPTTSKDLEDFYKEYQRLYQKAGQSQHGSVPQYGSGQEQKQLQHLLSEIILDSVQEIERVMSPKKKAYDAAAIEKKRAEEFKRNALIEKGSAEAARQRLRGENSRIYQQLALPDIKDRNELEKKACESEDQVRQHTQLIGQKESEIKNYQTAITIAQQVMQSNNYTANELPAFHYVASTFFPNGEPQGLEFESEDDLRNKQRIKAVLTQWGVIRPKSPPAPPATAKPASTIVPATAPTKR